MIESVDIAPDECRRMLAAAAGGVGRIALSGHPAMIRPVNYAFDDETQSVVFRSALGSRLREGLGSGTAAFEIDGTDPVERAGWSVIMVGEAEEVTDPAEISGLTPSFGGRCSDAPKPTGRPRRRSFARRCGASSRPCNPRRASQRRRCG
jgi:nitroimidazol reductase NimA-like FMN-containing flavoprotein (pyridoxamine 5'-phosphate oxidase superfamily)